MSRKCPECSEAGGRAHLPGCSYGPTDADRAVYLRDNALAVVRQLEDKIRRQAKELAQLAEATRARSKALLEIAAERDALKLVHTEARELVGEADAEGVIPQANVEALRALLWRASLKGTKACP